MKKSTCALISLLILGACIISGLILCARSESTHIRILRLPHTMPQNHPVHIAMQSMADQVAKESKGSLLIQIYPNGLLGDGSQIRELMQLGVVDIGKFSACDFEDNIPEIAAFCLPYLFKDEKTYREFLHSEKGNEILQAGYDTNAAMKGLCYYDAGARSFYSRIPIKTVHDLKNKKVRVMVSALMVAGVEAMGAVPTSMAWGELFTALQTGTVDAAENNIPSFFTSKHYEVCKYFILSEHFRTPDILAMTRTAWDSLSPEHQQILQKAATDSAIYEQDLWDKSSIDYIEKMKTAGVSFIEIDKDEITPNVEQFYATLREKAIGDKRLTTIMQTVDKIIEASKKEGTP